MVYTDLENLKGLDQPTDYGSGIEYADGILGSLFPNVDVGLQVSSHIYLSFDEIRHIIISYNIFW
jgi:hypothetical protein